MSPLIVPDLRQAFVRLHILYHAGQGPVFGVELMAELAEHGYRVGPGTIYPALHDLEAQGLLRREERVSGGRRRKYYVATRRGRALLHQARGMVAEWLRELEADGGR
jgi:DNA-binding PadR family transcriptional regulator